VVLFRAGRYQQPCHRIGEIAWQRPELGACLRIQLVRRDVRGNVKPRARRFAGPGVAWPA
jgi:hypothetical protein